MVAPRPAALAAAVLLTCLTAGASSADDLSRRTASWPKPDSDKAEIDRSCAHLGQGYRRPPGSDTCIRVGGSVRTETTGVWSR